MYEVCGPDKIGGSDDHANFWNRVLRNQVCIEDIMTFYQSEGFGSATDLPLLVFWKELYKRVPNVKVVLTVRDKPETWWASVKETINSGTVKSLHKFPLNVLTTLRGYKVKLEMSEECKDRIKLGFEDNMTPSEAKQFYDAHVEEVKSIVAEEDLLVFKASQGWKPLCEFLGVKEPEEGEPFPRANSKADLNGLFDSWMEEFRQYLTMAYFMLAILGMYLIIA